MSFRGTWRALLAVSVVALVVAGGATASGDDARGIDLNQGDSLVEVTVASKAAARSCRRMPATTASSSTTTISAKTEAAPSP